MEQSTSTLDSAHLNPDAASEMVSLAEYWDTLGSVYAAEGDATAATRYFRSAWHLGGEGLCLDHVAQLEAKAGNKPAALQDLSLALGGKLDDRETDQITRRAQRLGEPHPQATSAPQTLSLPTLHLQDGSATFDLVFTHPGDAPPVVTWLAGDTALKSAASTIASASFPTQYPDSGPEHIARRGHLQCTASGGCTLTLLYAWQAQVGNRPPPVPGTAFPSGAIR